MKLTAGILILGMALGAAWAQDPRIIDSTRAKLNTAQQQQAAASNEALSATQGQSDSAKSTPASSASAATKNSAVQPKQVTVVPVASAKSSPAAKDAGKKPAAPPAPAAKQAEPAPVVAVEDKKNPVDPKKDDEKTINVAGRRDPFISPVVNRSAVGSGCSTGKRCLAIDQIALTGIVKADSGMIAVVVNALNKAYFLRENDPVFNGYVVKITGDSIIFKETIQDKLGKPFTREVTKRISTPAV
jgi:hypothetical protein